MSDEVLARIEAWRATGLIDDETAERLRGLEASAGGTLEADGAGPRLTISAAFGPTPAVTEVFGYAGAGFLVAAWLTLSSSWLEALVGIGEGGAFQAWRGLQFAIPAAVLFGLGWRLGQGSDRARRAAGVAVAAATILTFAAADTLISGLMGPDVPETVTTAGGAIALVPETAAVAGGLAALVTALAGRRLIASVLTQAALLGALIALAAAGLALASASFFPDPCAWGCFEPTAVPAGVGLAKVGLTLAWWLVWAVALGFLVAAREAASAARAATVEERAAASRRAALSRLAAGLVAVVGTTQAMTSSGSFGPEGWGRFVPAVAGDAVIVLVAIVLLWIATRRGALAYLLPAALGLIVALSDFNGQVIAERTGTGVALLLEGLILIGVGVVSDRLRRRLVPVSEAPGAATT